MRSRLNLCVTGASGAGSFHTDAGVGDEVAANAREASDDPQPSAL
jgi:hypothetical protein